MSYAGSITSQLLRSLVAARIGQQTGETEGGLAVAKAASEKTKEAREAMVAAAQAAVANRTAGLTDPNDPNVLAAKERARVAGDIQVHTANRLTDVAHPTRDMSGSTPGAPDKAALRMRSAYKAKLMAPSTSRYGTKVPGMSEAEAEEITTEAWGPAPSSAADVPNTSTRALLSGSILRGGGAAGQPGSGASTSTASKGAAGGTAERKTSSNSGSSSGSSSATVSALRSSAGAAPETAPRTKPAAVSASAIPTGTNLKERDMDPADLWDKKVREGMTPVQATAYVKRLKGTG